jgi:hypothetical protein
MKHRKMTRRCTDSGKYAEDYAEVIVSFRESLNAYIYILSPHTASRTKAMRA